MEISARDIFLKLADFFSCPINEFIGSNGTSEYKNHLFADFGDGVLAKLFKYERPDSYQQYELILFVGENKICRLEDNSAILSKNQFGMILSFDTPYRSSIARFSVNDGNSRDKRAMEVLAYLMKICADTQ